MVGAQCTALLINCSLKPSTEPSSTALLAKELGVQFENLQVNTSQVRIADFAIKTGVDNDMGNGDQWPEIRQSIYAADILVIATPIWMGHMSSYTQPVLERLDAELSETDNAGRLRLYGKVGGAVIVGNEDGAHHVSAEIFQGLNDIGFSLAPGAVTYWVGEALQTVNYKDLGQTPDTVASTTKTMAINSAHLARVLKANAYPPS